MCQAGLVVRMAREEAAVVGVDSEEAEKGVDSAAAQAAVKEEEAREAARAGEGMGAASAAAGWVEGWAADWAGACVQSVTNNGQTKKKEGQRSEFCVCEQGIGKL